MWCSSPENLYALFEAKPPLGGLGGLNEDEIYFSNVVVRIAWLIDAILVRVPVFG